MNLTQWVSNGWVHRLRHPIRTVSNGFGINLSLDDVTGYLKRKLLRFRRGNLISCYRAASKWVEDHSQHDKGIVVSNKNEVPYPEVSGYFIPTLLNWGEQERAIEWARWLVSIQDTDGSWWDHHHTRPYTFDTGQILKGLISLVDVYPEYREPIVRGCDWILKQAKASGQITTPDISQWPRWRGRKVPEAIHLYCMEPIRDAGRKWGRHDYVDAVNRALNFYLSKADLTDFNTLSHFHAYIVEALVDLGEVDRATEAMDQITELQRKFGFVPAYRDVKWVCSTGLLQYAVIWYKLGEKDLADEAFAYACSLQNDSGGFYGSYGARAHYFPRQEISWAVKYFLDALHWKNRRSLDAEAELLHDSSIHRHDGRFQLIAHAFEQASPNRIVDMGCGKGRFLNRLLEDYPNVEAYGMDLSEKMLEYLSTPIIPFHGGLLKIPAPDGFFDFAFCIETLEHAVAFPQAIREMSRVVAPDGMLVIIGKNKEKLGALKISEWEQWLDENEIKQLLRREGFSVALHRGISYEHGSGDDNLFLGWVAKKESKG